MKLVSTLSFVKSQETHQGPTVGLRERNKAKRRHAVLDATLDLLGQHPLGEVSIERIAERAEVAPATVYNLLGNREQLLLACVDRVIDQLVDSLIEVDPAEDPIRAAVLIVEQSADAFTGQRAAYRQILGALGDFSRTGSMMALDPAQLQIAAMREAQVQGYVRADIDPEAVGRQIYLSYNGAVFAWAGLGLDDAGFRAAALHGLWTTLAAIATDAHRDRFLAELRTTGAALTAAGWGTP